MYRLCKRHATASLCVIRKGCVAVSCLRRSARHAGACNMRDTPVAARPIWKLRGRRTKSKQACSCLHAAAALRHDWGASRRAARPCDTSPSPPLPALLDRALHRVQHELRVGAHLADDLAAGLHRALQELPYADVAQVLARHPSRESAVAPAGQGGASGTGRAGLAPDACAVSPLSH